MRGHEPGDPVNPHAPDTPADDESAAAAARWRVDLSRVARLTRKELSEILRDRRTILTLVAMPLLLYPLISVAFQQFFLASRVDPAHGMDYRAGLATEEEEQVFLVRMAKGDGELERRRKPESATPTTPETAKRSRLETVQGDPAALEQALREGKIDLIVRVPKAAATVFSPEAMQRRPRDWRLECEIVYLAGAPAPHGALAYVENRLAAANEADLLRRLNIPGVLPKTIVLQPTRVPIETADGDGVVSLAALRAAHSRPDDHHRGGLPGHRSDGRRARARDARNSHGRPGAPLRAAIREVSVRADRRRPDGARQSRRHDDHAPAQRAGQGAVPERRVDAAVAGTALRPAAAVRRVLLGRAAGHHELRAELQGGRRTSSRSCSRR